MLIGHGVITGVSEAAKWYRLAADQGLASAQWMLGFCFANGHGVIADSCEAMRWYGLAADQGVSGIELK